MISRSRRVEWTLQTSYFGRFCTACFKCAVPPVPQERFRAPQPRPPKEPNKSANDSLFGANEHKRTHFHTNKSREQRTQARTYRFPALPRICTSHTVPNDLQNHRGCGSFYYGTNIIQTIIHKRSTAYITYYIIFTRSLRNVRYLPQTLTVTKLLPQAGLFVTVLPLQTSVQIHQKERRKKGNGKY
jgi:hypothetical protein